MKYDIGIPTEHLNTSWQGFTIAVYLLGCSLVVVSGILFIRPIFSSSFLKSSIGLTWSNPDYTQTELKTGLDWTLLALTGLNKV